MLNYNINEVKEKMSFKDIHIIKGIDNKEYFVIYKNTFTPSGEGLDIYIFNDKGILLKKLTNKDANSSVYRIVDSEYIYYENGYTELHDNYILFYSASNNDECENITMNQYKLTINNDKMNYEFIKSYKQNNVAGSDEGCYLNPINNE